MFHGKKTQLLKSLLPERVKLGRKLGENSSENKRKIEAQ